ncbi:hypothetical protein BaRGS_00006528 [Batillaria attramentaria]|uniref:Uncharacterized protein n=1 Tax=Batillaria attramentaria TaxID=370345 RepID=A0ABD0LT21_9CAEN
MNSSFPSITDIGSCPVPLMPELKTSHVEKRQNVQLQFCLRTDDGVSFVSPSVSARAKRWGAEPLTEQLHVHKRADTSLDGTIGICYLERTSSCLARR